MTMTLSPKFKITVLGVAQGYHPERVRAALERRFKLTPRQVEQVLSNQAGPLLGLLDHQMAWNLKNRLHEIGVSCRIAPVPLSYLANVERRMSLQAQVSERRVGQPPRVQRASQQAMYMRSGKAAPAAKTRSAKAGGLANPLWRGLAVALLATLLGWYMLHPAHDAADGVVIAEAVH